MKCAICNSSELFVSLYPDICETKNYLCYTCGLVFLQDSLVPHTDYYEKDGYYEKSPNRGLRDYVVNKSLMENLGNVRLKLIEDSVSIDFSNKTVLDVGCGYGQILSAIKSKYSAKVFGVEPSKKIAALGKKYFDIEIKPVVLEEYNSENKYDVVMCLHTLEHVNDPINFIETLKQYLKPEGVMYIEVPNVMVPTGGFHIDKFLYNEHLFTYSESSLEKLLNKCGLQVVDYNSTDFLRFVVAPVSKPKQITREIMPAEIENFLRDYKNNYTYLNHAKVNIGKLGYLFKVIKYKFVDTIKNIA